jgi:transcriptional adapter 2-alpha
MNAVPPPAPKAAPTSAPGIHEVAGFLPGRLEFEHELDNEAEDLVKDLEFGICLDWDGDKIPEDDQDIDVKARAKMVEDAKMRESTPAGKRLPNGLVNGILNGHRFASGTPKADSPAPKVEDKGDGNDEDADEPTLPPPIETKDSLQFKLALLEMYRQRVDKRHEAKAVIFDRGLLHYKQVSAPISLTEALPPNCNLDASKREETSQRGEGCRPPPSSFCSASDCRRFRSFRCRHLMYTSLTITRTSLT